MSSLSTNTLFWCIERWHNIKKNMLEISFSTDFFFVLGAVKTTEESRPSRDDLRFPDYDFSAVAADTNCILHLFGAWLFDACLSGVDMEKVLPAIGIISCGSRPKSTYAGNEENEHQRCFVFHFLKFVVFF